MLEKWNKSKKVAAVIYLCIFVIMLICNLLTPLAVDDFTYLYSFATDDPIRKISDIFPSMASHARTMNGRLSAHFLVQLFVLMPMWVFDVVNALIFCLMIGLIEKISVPKGRNNLLTAAIFCAVWFFEPAFGQVNLWQDGAVNYLWSVPVGLLYVLPFVNRFLQGKSEKWSKPIAAGFLLFSFFAGSYSETVSAAVIFVAVQLIVLDVLYNKRKISVYNVASVSAAFLGYVSIYLAPAQWMNKSVAMSVKSLFNNIITATERYESFGVLAVIYVVLLVVCICEKTDGKTIWLSLVFVLGSLAANYIMVLAGYYPERSAVGAVVLLIVADGILVVCTAKTERYQAAAVSMLLVLLLVTTPHLLKGVRDVATTWLRISENEAIILESREKGDLDVDLPVFYPATKYSVIYDAKYLDMENPESWPNRAMAKYYGVNSIIGIPRSD